MGVHFLGPARHAANVAERSNGSNGRHKWSGETGGTLPFWVTLPPLLLEPLQCEFSLAADTKKRAGAARSVSLTHPRIRPSAENAACFLA
jgi:hypothetical protein